MPKIAIDARESGTSTGRYIDKLIEYLHKLKPETEVIVLTKSGRLDFIKTIAPTFRVVESNFKEFTFAEQFGFREQLRKLNPDLVHFGMTHQPIYYYGRSVTTVHDLTTARFRNPAKPWLVFKFKQQVYRVVIFWVAHKSKRLMTPSQYVKTDLAKFARVKPAKVTVTNEAADKISEPAKPVEVLKGKKFLMYVGRPTPHKNLERLVHAFKILEQTDPQLHLVLAGKQDKNYERIEKLVSKLGLDNKVVFTGFITEGQLRWLYENTALYVFPSLSEGFGLPGLEAMAHGAPVAASRGSCLPEVYGQAAHYFDPSSVEDMAAKIREVMADNKLRLKLIDEGRAQVKKYSWQKMAQQTLDIYKSVL